MQPRGRCCASIRRFRLSAVLRPALSPAGRELGAPTTTRHAPPTEQATTSQESGSLVLDLHGSSFPRLEILACRREARHRDPVAPRWLPTDAIFTLNSAFVPGSPFPVCREAADADANTIFNGLVDGIFTLNFGFVPGSPPLTAPFPDCGPDPDFQTSLGCAPNGCP